MNLKSGMLEKFMQCRPPFHFGTSLDEFEVVTFNVLSMVGIVLFTINNSDIAFRIIETNKSPIGLFFWMPKSKFLHLFYW